MDKNFQKVYIVLMILILSTSIIGSTYAYLTASTSSASNSVNTKSKIYQISMNIIPIYSGFSLIPMNDSDAIKALNNKCHDKYDRGACVAYKLYVYDYDESLEYISGYMNTVTNNMQNLSFMILEESPIQTSTDNCATINEKTYCLSQDTTKIIPSTDLSLGDAYKVSGQKDKELILLIWLSNLEESQNETDIGSFQSTITIQAGNGGEIKGTIASSIKIAPPEGGTT